MPRAFSLIRPLPHYRHDAFLSGLRAAGYTVVQQGAEAAERGDVICMWNRYGSFDGLASRAEARGAVVLVAENGYLGHDETGQRLYALARHGHNGSGEWRPGGPERWPRLGVTLAPWRAEGDHIVVVAQRGIGSRTMASPPNWHRQTAARLQQRTKRRVVIREHPGKPACDPAVTEQFRGLLKGAHAVVIWSSANGVRALAEGVPVIFAAPHWILEGAASSALDAIENPPMPDRLPAFERLAWAQWTVDELASGIPFRRLLETAA